MALSPVPATIEIVDEHRRPTVRFLEWLQELRQSVAAGDQGGSLGPEWVRVDLPSGTFTIRTAIDVTTAPTKQSAAPTELTVHTGAGANIRLTPDWEPAVRQSGWWLVPHVDEVTYGARAVFVPLNAVRQRGFLSYVRAASPAVFYGCSFEWLWDDVNGYIRLDFFRFNAAVEIPADAWVGLHPAF